MYVCIRNIYYMANNLENEARTETKIKRYSGVIPRRRGLNFWRETFLVSLVAPHKCGATTADYYDDFCERT